MKTGLWYVFVAGVVQEGSIAAGDATEAVKTWRADGKDRKWVKDVTAVREEHVKEKSRPSPGGPSPAGPAPATLLHNLKEAASSHGLDTEPEHEVRDLHQILASCWEKLTLAQQRAVYAEHEVLVDRWSGLPPPRTIETLIRSAVKHGDDSDPDHEVGDLQEILQTCAATLSPAQLARAYKANKPLVEEWLPYVLKVRPAKRGTMEHMVSAAEAHGEHGAPEDERNDLKQILRSCAEVMTAEQIAAVYDAHEDLVDEWLV